MSRMLIAFDVLRLDNEPEFTAGSFVNCVGILTRMPRSGIRGISREILFPETFRDPVVDAGIASTTDEEQRQQHQQVGH